MFRVSFITRPKNFSALLLIWEIIGSKILSKFSNFQMRRGNNDVTNILIRCSLWPLRDRYETATRPLRDRYETATWPLRDRYVTANDISVSYPAKDSENLFERKTQIGFHNLFSSERVIDAVNSVGYSSKQWHQQRVYPITTRRSLRDQPLFFWLRIRSRGSQPIKFKSE